MVECSTLFCLLWQEGSEASANNKEAELAPPVQGWGDVPHLCDASRGAQPSRPPFLLGCCLLKLGGVCERPESSTAQVRSGIGRINLLPDPVYILVQNKRPGGGSGVWVSGGSRAQGPVQDQGTQGWSQGTLIRKMIHLFISHYCYYYYAHKPELCKNFTAQSASAHCEHKIKRKMISFEYLLI